jgi:hypothetical protein
MSNLTGNLTGLTRWTLIIKAPLIVVISMAWLKAGTSPPTSQYHQDDALSVDQFLCWQRTLVFIAAPLNASPVYPAEDA